MMVEDTSVAGRVPHRAGDVFDPSSKHCPMLIAKTLLGANAPGVLRTDGVFTVFISPDNEGRSANCREQFHNADCGFCTCCMSVRVGKIQQQERVKHFQIASL
jgi:hypothetical protein